VAGATTSIVNADTPKEPVKPQPADDEQTHSQFIYSFGVVYVNDIARQAMLTRQRPSFPVGSVIVREKLRTETSTTPSLLSVMIKREKGFSPGSGDWEFIVSDLAEGQLQQRQLKIDCMSCHGKQNEDDYVFRTYLPDEARQKLR